ncbi:MAG: 5'-methylthioadenosine/S-adenosylhomocysteine nucleosidase [candidate division Zixibacteria bacterium]|nr:5'-methylthioadenosine/S-adenosylhomocysteine nucleosidase [candidate division Zixibacteria bacterium]
MKRKLMIILVLFFILFLSIQSSAGTKGKIVLMYAFDQEGVLLRSRLSLQDSLFVKGRIFWIGKLSTGSVGEGKEVIIVNSGVGMTNAAMTTQLLIDKYNPEKIIFTGICGGIDSVNHIGDIVIPESWATHDYGYYGKEGFLPDSVYVVLPGNEREAGILYFEVDKNLLEKAKSAGQSLKLKPVQERIPQVKTGGKGVSGNSFIDQKEKRDYLKDKFGAEIVDMESAAVVQVANVNGVPVLVVRSCSDLAGGSGSATAALEIKDFFKVAADNSANFVIELVKQLE